jgi:hypothetical protein
MYALDCARYLQCGAAFGSHTLAGSAFTFLTLTCLVPQRNTQFRSQYFSAEFFPQDWSPFLQFPLVWKWFEGFFTVMCERLQWCFDTSHTVLKLGVQILIQRKLYRIYVNPLNSELNSICHLLVLLANLTFIGPCIVNIVQYIFNKMQCYTVYLYLETVLHVSGGISTHHRQLIQLYPQHLVFVTPLLLSAAIVEELEPVWTCCGWLMPHTERSNQFQLFHDSIR